MKLRISRAWTVAVLLMFGLAFPVLSQDPPIVIKLPSSGTSPKEVKVEAVKLLQATPAQPVPQAVKPAAAQQLGSGISFLEKAIDNARPRDPRGDAKLLALRIDQLIESRLAKEGIQIASRAEEAQNLRRLTLDLTGKIPNLLVVRDFIDATNDDPDKREKAMESMLDGPEFARHFGNILRSLMLPNNENIQAQQFQPAFENWLREKLRAGVGYDKVVEELLISQPLNGNPNGGAGSPAGFFFANELKPENLAGATARVFLGVKIECAQCHAHPFAKWTKNQFWEFAAFFAGFNQRGGRGGVANNQFVKEIPIPGVEKVAKAKFLTGEEPKWRDNVPTLTILSEWMTSNDNPYFARAAVDHFWQYFFGVSLLEPILEPQGDNLVTHPELLDELAREFVAHRYDVKFLMRAIVQTKAYQRASANAAGTSQDYNFFARMPVRGLTPEQLFDSLAEATDFMEPTNTQMQQLQFNPFGPQTPRREFLAKFATQDKRIETQTSILQALFMMNGKFLAERVKLENNKSLFTIATSKVSTARRVETLYLLVLSRLPRAEESERFVRYIDAGGASGDPRQAVADVYWVLLNSSEFLLNH